MTSGVRPSPAQATASSERSAAPTSHCGLRIADFGIEVEGPILGAGQWTRRSHGPFRNPQSAIRILLLAQRKEVSKEPISAGNPGGQLSEKAQSRVDVRPPAEPGHEQPALERGLAGIVGLEQRRIGGVPIVGEIEPALLNTDDHVARGYI